MSARRERLAAAAAALVAMAAALVWMRLHSVRLERDGELAALCTKASGRPRADLDRDYAALGVSSVETFAGDSHHLTYTMLVTSLQSFSCLVELDDADRVRSAHPFRMAYAEATRFFELPRWSPPWAEDGAQLVRRALSSVGTALTP